MFTNMEFTYDGIHSSAMGVSLVSIDMDNRPFGVKRSVVEEKISHIAEPYFYGFEEEKLSFKITLAKLNEDDNKWTYEERLKIVQWMWKDGYRPFVSLDNPEVVYYCTPVGEAERFDNGNEEGYVTITMECNSPYAYTPTYIEVYDSVNATSNIFEIENRGNIENLYYPEVQVEMVGSTSVSIKNLTSAGQEFKFENLNIGEKVYVNNKTNKIITDVPNTYRLSNFNKQWLRLEKGINQLEITGDVKVLFRCSYPISI